MKEKNTKVNLIYFDPPYNTGRDFSDFNDKYETYESYRNELFITYQTNNS